jgi:hypothetical protein
MLSFHHELQSYAYSAVRSLLWSKSSSLAQSRKAEQVTRRVTLHAGDMELVVMTTSKKSVSIPERQRHSHLYWLRIRARQ